MQSRIRCSAGRGAGALLALAACGAAHGQTVPAAPQTLQVSPIPHIAPPSPPPLGGAVPNFQPLNTEGAVPDLSIKIGSVAILGATAFPAAQLQQSIAGLAGRTVKLARLEAARRALVSLYRSHGFILTTVSLEIDAQGDVQYVVTEGHIVAIKLSRDIGPAGTMVLRFLDHLTEQRPISEAALERWLLLAQQIPGVSLHAVLQADNSDPGALTLVAVVAKQDVSALVTADDRSFKGTGPAEVLLVGDLNSLTEYGDQTEISIFHTSGGTDNFGQAAESFYLGDDGLRLRLYGGAGRAWPGGALRAAGYESNLEVAGGQLAYPVLLQRDAALNATLHFDITQNEINTAGLRTSYDSLRVARLAGQYAWQDLVAGSGRDAVSIFDAQVSQGIPLLGASPDNAPAGTTGRLGGKFDFWKLNGALSRTQTLCTPLPDATLALRLEAGGQYTADILPSEEEFSLGGARFTRGFYSGEVSGDKAAYTTAELQFNTGYSFSVLKQPLDIGAQFYGFYDWGESWSNLKADLGHRLVSAGGGVRLGLTRYVEIDGEAVERLTTRLDPGSPGILPLSETVIYWGVTARY